MTNKPRIVLDTNFVTWKDFLNLSCLDRISHNKQRLYALRCFCFSCDTEDHYMAAALTLEQVQCLIDGFNNTVIQEFIIDSVYIFNWNVRGPIEYDYTGSKELVTFNHERRNGNSARRHFSFMYGEHVCCNDLDFFGEY